MNSAFKIINKARRNMQNLNFFRTKADKDSYARKEYSAGNFVPYLCHWNQDTILTKNKELLQVIKFTGFSFETADDIDVDIKKSLRNSLLKGLSSGNLVIYFHTIRKKESVVYEDDAPIDPNIEYPKNFASYLDRKWREKHTSRKGFVNELYMTVLRKADTKGAALFQHIFKQLQQKTDKTAWESDIKDFYEELSEVTTRIINSFQAYGPELLGVRETENGVVSDTLTFLGALVNCGAVSPMLVPATKISDYLPTDRLLFGSKAIEARGAIGKRYAGIVSVKEYSPHTYAGIFDKFLQVPFEFIMTQSFTFANRQVAIGKMQLQQNRMIQAEDKAVSQIVEISKALDMATSGEIAFGEHHLSILCVENTMKSLEGSLSMAAVELSNAGLTPVRETINMEACYWGQLPGNYDYIVRKAPINTLNLSGFASLHNYPSGKPYGNHWGEAVTVFDTTSGTPFFFNFHVKDVGHTMIIGPTGAGKTVLMNFLCAQSQKFGCRMFFFDKDHGAEIFIRAINGLYTDIDPNTECHFNPLQLPDTSDNRTFLLDWLRLLVTTNGETLSSEDIAKLNDAINGNYKLAKKDRTLANIAPFLGMETPGSLSSRLRMWHSNGSHSKVFGGLEDSINFNEASSFGFEMGNLLRDSISLGPVLLYLFHRISISLDGTPTMIVLDEAWALIDNPIFGPKLKDWLKVLRKLNAFVIFATQSVEDATRSDISDTLVQQTATQIFLPNLRATEVYKKVFMLSQREYILIKTTDPSTRYFLVKQGVNAVIARIDLSGMDDIINVLSGRAETVILMHEIINEVGDDPEEWLPVFYKRTKGL